MKYIFLGKFMRNILENEFVRTISSLEFWVKLIDSFALLGPIAPMLLMVIEAIIPALPLVAIVTLNVASHGMFFGFLYSWIGGCIGCFVVFMFWRKVGVKLFDKIEKKNVKIQKAKKWVSEFKTSALFMVIMMPFTPSCFVNFAFGVSDFDAKKYMITLIFAKLVMIGLLACFGKSVVKAMENPVFIILAIAMIVLLWVVSDIINKKHGLKDEK